MIAVGIVDRVEHGVDPEAAAILSKAPALGLITALRLGETKCPLRLPGFAVLWREEDGEVPADDLVRGIALEPLCAGIPRRNPARWIEHVDRIIGDGIDEQLETLLLGEAIKVRHGRKSQRSQVHSPCVPPP